MKMTVRPRLHIIGARGQLGSHLVNAAKADFDIIAYSSKVIREDQIHQKCIHYPLKEAGTMVERGEPVIFLSHSQDRKDVEQLRQLLQTLAAARPHIIFISTLAVYSSYKSIYAEIKEELETLVQSFSSFSIIRLGFVYGRSFGGLSKVFSKLAKNKVMAFPHDTVKTGFVTLDSACESMLNVALNGPTRQVEDHYHIFLNLKRAFDLFGFRGKAVTMPSVTYTPILRLLQYFRPVTPQSIQSLISICFINSDAFIEKQAYPYLRCFILADFAKLFGTAELWQLRRYIRKIEATNTLSSYINLGRSAQFMFLYRLKEIMEVERDQQDKPLQN